MSPGNIYANRGYGFVLDWSAPNLNLRWRLLDPRSVELNPSIRQEVIDGPIDLNGDGFIDDNETVRHLHPMLRLLAYTSSTASVSDARIDIDVLVVGGSGAKRSIEQLTREALTELFGAGAAQAPAEPRKLGPDFDARIVEGDTPRGPFRLALIDQPGFVSEGDIPRRQAVRVALYAREITSALRADFNQIIESILLNRRGSPPTQQEQW
ncbi:MAG: hypothetical protein IT384_12480 [Deltaproteobacteria bacterium]|nr:hypothetical protein [Deltaproteobacteria bacterium]